MTKPDLDRAFAPTPDIFIGTQDDAVLPLYSYDYYDGEDGAQILLIEFNLNHLDADAIAEELAENLDTQINRGDTLPEDYREKTAGL
jgi:hypothetical protein